MSSTLQPEQNNSQFSITGYGEDFIEINREKWALEAELNKVLLLAPKVPNGAMK